MAGDYTRRTFTSKTDYSGVLMQQGRVTLDADFNELVELLDHRLRAEVVDLFGRCVVSRETPGAFLIAASGGALTIGRGRAYVDGLLAENHGADPLAYDPVIGELHGTSPVAYDKQPYLPNPAPLPTSGTYVAYLDVWRREVTYLEDPGLLEKAIGVDTSARTQTVWQLRLLEAPDGTTCDAQLPGWDALTAPSAGRLTTAAVGVPASTDPCTIPPNGGYRGTENRLYRVEIHDGGPLGTATFTWSRDNASIASRVDTIDAARTELVVARLGRDGVQRIGVDDWVEVNDDWLELNGLPGELRKVAAVDEVRDAITLSAPLTAGVFDATDASRHTRVTRWDQAGAAVDAAGGVITVPTGGTPIVLEDGVQITFGDDPAGGDLRTGDHWVLAARTADASVQELDDEPPVGIQHHYCRVAVVTFPDTVIDCRMPPVQPDGGHDCACDVCVTPESHASGAMTIQHAVDTVHTTGGKVCLQVGLYRVDKPVAIDGARSIEIQGKGWKTIVITNGRAPAFIVERSLGVTIDRLAIVTSSVAGRTTALSGIAIVLRNTIETIIERCALLQLGLLQDPPTPPPPGGPGDQPPGEPDPCPPENLRAAIAKGQISDFAAVFGPKGAGAPLIVLDGLVVETVIQENVLIGTTGIGSLTTDLLLPIDPGAAAAAPAQTKDIEAAYRSYLMTYDLHVKDNVLVCWLTGVSLEGYSMQLGDTEIRQNSLLVCLRGAIVTTGITGAGGRVDTVANIVRVLGYGIVAATNDTRIEENDVARLTGLGASTREGSLVSISSGFAAAGGTSQRVLALFGGAAIVLVSGLRARAIERCQITANRVFGTVGDAIVIHARVHTAAIDGNQVSGVGGGGIVMGPRGAADILTVEGNQLVDLGLLRDDEKQTAAAIDLSASRDVCIAGNAIDGVGRNARSASRRAGIAVTACDSVRITQNTVTGVGPPDQFFGVTAGILVLDAFQRADVLDNSVRRAEGDPPPDPQSPWYGILIAGAGKGAKPAGAAFTVVSGESAYRFHPALGRGVKLPLGRASLAVRGNVVEAYGTAPAVLIETIVPCLFNDNRCFLAARENLSTARVQAAAAVAANNYLEGSEKLAGLEIEVPAAAPFTILGNISGGGVALNGAPIPAPWHQLNVP